MADQRIHKVDFLGIGFSKCGSTTLDEYLRQIPGIHLPTYTKEVHYFDWYFQKGERWYHSKFPEATTGIYGEITPSYVKSIDYLRRIHDYHPEIKIMLILRNPADRIYSRYKHAYQNNHLKQTLPDFIEEKGFLNKSIYLEDVLTVFEIFGRSRTHIVIFEEMIQAPEQEMTKLLQFLGASTNQVKVKSHHANRSEIPANRALYRILKKGVRWLKAFNLDWITEAVKKTSFKKRLMSKQTFGPMPTDIRKKIDRVYEKEIKSLSCLLDKDLSTLWHAGGKHDV